MKKYSALVLAVAMVGTLAVASTQQPVSPVAASNLGQLDQSFGGTGEVTSSIAGEDWVITDVVVQPDGKVLAAGNADIGNRQHVFIARFNSDGTFDSTWNAGQPREVFVQRVNQPTDESGATAIALQSDGKVIIAGYVAPTSSGFHMALVRLDTSGALDTSFDQDGIVVTGHLDASIITDVVVAPSGSIIVAGASMQNGIPQAQMMHLVARYDSTGSLDPSFNPGGSTPGIFTFNQQNGDNSLQSVILQSDGHIIVGGSVAGSGSISRVTPNGTLDTTFGTQGHHIFVVSGDTAVRAVALQADGKIIAAGIDGPSQSSTMFVIRIDQTGTTDTSFNGGAYTAANLLDFSWVGDMAILRDGRIVVVGYTVQSPSRSDLVMWLVNPDGTADTSVFPSGIKTLTKGGIAQGGDYRIRAVAIQSDDKIVVAGELEQSDNQPLLARFHSVIAATPVPSPTPAPTPVVAAAVTGAPSVLRYRAANKNVTLRWRSVEGASSYVVTTTRGAQRCDTTATSCTIPRLRNGKAYTYLVYSVNADGVRSETATRVTARPGFVVKRTSLKQARTLKLSSIVTTKSRGAKTWRVTSGGCRIQNGRLVAPARRGSCRLRLATAKRGSYPAMSTTIKITITR